MSNSISGTSPAPPRQTAAWGAVISMLLGVFGLVTAEFLPASLLTPIARDLRVTEGLAGQAVTATASVALITSLLVASLSRRLDRRYLLLGFSVLLIASNLLVASATSLTTLVLGRVVLGIGLGGFWTMAAATAMRLVPESPPPPSLPRPSAVLSARWRAGARYSCWRPASARSPSSYSSPRCRAWRRKAMRACAP
jgi:MFS family permease